MYRAALLAACAVFGLACSPGSERFVSKPLGLSTEAPAGWEHETDRNTVVFSSPEDLATIAIRAVTLRAPDEPDLSLRQQALRATESVLATLPQAKVIGPTPLSHPRFRGARYALRFVPPGRDEPYDREHVVLVGQNARAFHLVHTAPAGQLEASDEEFFNVMFSLRQEGSR